MTKPKVEMPSGGSNSMDPKQCQMVDQTQYESTGFNSLKAAQGLKVHTSTRCLMVEKLNISTAVNMAD